MSEELWFESIPNFSEGRRAAVLDAIKTAAKSHGAHVLGMEADIDHNRSVLTIAGGSSVLLEALYQTMAVALTHIDLNQHTGVHPRIGAVDVVPFVPLRGAQMADAVRLAHELGERVADGLNLPVYFYEAAARMPERKNLAALRRGEFEGLAERMRLSPPDLGPGTPHPTAGAVVIGARKPLIAFNVYLNTDNLARAKAVARAVRGSSGGLIGVKALGFDTKSQGRVQVSMNLVDYPTTPLPRALELVREEARRLSVEVVETELVGFMPMDAVEDVVRYYLQLPGFYRGRILETALAERKELVDDE